MYFFDINGLCEALFNRPNTPRQDLQYLIGFSLVGTSPLSWGPSEGPWSVWLDLSLIPTTIAITIFGVLFCFRANPTPDLFLSRFLSVGFVVGVRLMVFFGAPLVLAALAMGWPVAIEEEPNETADFAAHAISTVLYILVQMLFYWRIGIHLRRIGRFTEAA